MMIRKFSKDFFEPGPLAFLGYSSKSPAYSAEIKEALEGGGFAVHAVNKRPSAKLEAPVHSSLGELPPETRQAFVLLAGGRALEAVEELGKLGYKKVLFRSRGLAGQAALERAAALGMEVAAGCPLMAYGKGLHRFHGFLAGVRG
ncbi:MAG TPA: CoA-binding protein [Spirochaetia bacterium]|nr:CoA-binding protein [Spirochaetales bacterium]HRY71630.1 CoA-binding protein [Spirochaetia bacterium]